MEKDLNRSQIAALKAYPELAAEWMKVKTLQPMKRAIYKQGYEQAEKDTIERAAEWLSSIGNGVIIVDVKAFVEAFKNEIREDE